LRRRKLGCLALAAVATPKIRLRRLRNGFFAEKSFAPVDQTLSIRRNGVFAGKSDFQPSQRVFRRQIR
jgi:hypothetical protein